MKPLILLTLLSLLIGSASAETTTKPNLIVSTEPFTPDGVVEISKGNYPLAEALKTESGVFNGFQYKFYYSDGSGNFSGIASGNKGEYGNDWRVSCTKDSITDMKMCDMNMASIWISVYGNGKAIVSIGRNHFPGSSVTVRIDGGTPITASSANDGNFPAGTSAKIIERLKRGKSLTTRYMEWPYRSWIDGSWELYGFNEAFKYINWAVKHIK